MANSLFSGHGSPRGDRSASCSSYCSLGTRWKESRTGCPAFLSKFIVIEVVKYHRTLTSYLDFLLQQDFGLRRVVEPQPSEEMLRDIPGMKDELRRPMMLIVLAQKE